MMNNTIIGSRNLKQNLTGEISKAVEYIESKPITQEKTIIPTKETQEITCDKGYTGLSKVTVKPIPDNYVEVVEKNKNVVETFYEAYLDYYNNISAEYNKKYL